MKIIFFVALFSLIYEASISQDVPDYRKVRWGMSKAQVLKLEGGYDNFNQIGVLEVGNIKVISFNARLSYKFKSDKLIAAAILFTDSYSNDNQHIANFKSIDKVLESKYGKANTRKVSRLRNDDLYLSDPGYELYMGNSKYRTQWNKSRTIIKHTIEAPNNIIHHYIQYISKEHLKSIKRAPSENL